MPAMAVGVEWVQSIGMVNPGWGQVGAPDIAALNTRRVSAHTHALGQLLGGRLASLPLDCRPCNSASLGV